MAFQDSTTTAVQDMSLFTESWACDAARDLRLLRNIEETVRVLARIETNLRANQRMAESFVADIQEFQHQFDENRFLQATDRLEDELTDLRSTLDACLLAAKTDKALTEEDGVADAYRNTIEAVCNLYSIVEHVRWVLMHRNAELDPTGSKDGLSSSEEISRFLAAL